MRYKAPLTLMEKRGKSAVISASCQTWGRLWGETHHGGFCLLLIQPELLSCWHQARTIVSCWRSLTRTMSPTFCFLIVLLAHVGQSRTDTDGQVLAHELTEAQKAHKQQGIVDVLDYISNLTNVKQHVAPITHETEDDLTTRVSVLFSLASVLSLDDVQQTMKSYVYLHVTWQDETLAWNASDFHGVHTVEVPVGTVWAPDIFLVNSMDTGNIMLNAVRFKIRSDGTISTTLVLITDTLCNMDHGKFPYDTQHCSVIMHSYSQFVQLKLQLMVIDKSLLEKFVRKNEWEMVRQSVISLLWVDNETSMLSVQVELRRKTTFFTMCLVVPMVLTSYMNTLVFLVPLEAGEKVSFLVSIFISTSVFTSFFTSVMPRGLDVVPATMKLLVGVTTESLVLLVCTLLVMWRYHNSSRLSGGTTCHQSSFQLHTAHNSKAGSDSRQWCCSSREGLGGARVRPWLEEVQEKHASDGKEHRDSVRHSLPALTPQHLDCLFFLVSFLANTVFMCVLFFD